MNNKLSFLNMIKTSTSSSVKNRTIAKSKFRTMQLDHELPSNYVIKNIMDYSAVLSIKKSIFIDKIEYMNN